MSAPTRLPPQDVVLRERDTFIILQHVYTLSESRPEGLPVTEIATDLALAPERAESLVEHLLNIDFLRLVGSREVAVTPAGVAYVEELAWRRRTVRLEAPEA